MTLVLCGPARCGKTERLLARYRQELGLGGVGRALWLSPTQRSAADIRGRLPDASLPACLNPGVMTFDHFARRVIDASPMPIQPLSGSQKRQLVRRLIRDAAERGLTYFAAIAEATGLVDLVCELITDLKRLEIWPEDFERACQPHGMQAKDRELHSLYAAYQDCLNRHRLYDREGAFWWARDRLTSGQIAPFGQLWLIVVDGFADFTRTQHEILQVLAGRADEMIVSLPLEAEPRRDDLFGKSLATLDKLRELHAKVAVEEMPRPAEQPWPALRHVETELFKNPRHVRTAPNTNQIEILACPRPWGEIRTVGCRIKQLLVHGDPQLGVERVRPGEIMVVFRSLPDVAPLVREVFDEMGLPYALEAGLPLAEARPVMAVLNLLRLDVDDWPFRTLLAVLLNNYFHPAWPEWQVSSARLSTERLIRRLQSPRGRRQLLAQCARLAAIPVDEDDSLSDTAAEYAHRRSELSRDAKKAFPLLSRLSEALEQLPDQATPQKWAEALDALAKDTGLLSVIDAADGREQRQADRRAWDRMLAVLRSGEQLTSKIGELPLEVTRAELPSWLHDLLRGEQVPPDESESGHVRVLSAASARSLDVPYLFFAGLTENSFPSPNREDRLYGEVESRRLRELGLPVPLGAERGQEEMLLFYEVLTRATRRLYLSYPALDSKGQPLLASPYLTDLERACGERPIARQVSLDLSPIPNADEACSAADCRTLGVQSALQGEFDLLAGVRRDDRSKSTAQSLLRGLEVTAARHQRTAFGPYEGLLESGAAKAALAAKYGPEHCWSVSHLDQYAYCPFQFWLQRVIGVTPLEELSLETDHAARGWLLHETLAALHRRLNQALVAKEGEVSDEELLAWHQEALARILAQDPTDDALRAALQEVDRQVLSNWGSRYVQQHRSYSSGWDQFETPPTPAHFEVSFGLARKSSDELSTADALQLDTPAGRLKFSGRIDRIDVGHIHSQPVFVIVDYKSGQSPTQKEVHAARALQLPLYAIAVEELLLAGRQAMGWQAGYWQVRSGGYRSLIDLGDPQAERAAHSDQWLELRQHVLDRVADLVQGIRAAEFPVFSDDPECTSRCAFRTVCRVHQVRSTEKEWPPLP